MSFAMFWVVAMGIGVVGFGWVKIRRRRKAANAADAASAANVANAA
jgi:hypothetical protein